MSSWNKTDAAASAPLWASAYANAAPSSANRTNLFENASAGDFIAGMAIGLFNYTSSEVTDGAHQGWVLKKTGTGGRAGRDQYETIVTLTSNS
jgi:hypothetical protein